MLAWWPLKTIKWYESLSRQQFHLEAGPRAPMGEGVYVFKTRGDQDNQIFDQLDTFVMEAAGLCPVSQYCYNFYLALFLIITRQSVCLSCSFCLLMRSTSLSCMHHTSSLALRQVIGAHRSPIIRHVVAVVRTCPVFTLRCVACFTHDISKFTSVFIELALQIAILSEILRCLL